MDILKYRGVIYDTYEHREHTTLLLYALSELLLQYENPHKLESEYISRVTILDDCPPSKAKATFKRALSCVPKAMFDVLEELGEVEVVELDKAPNPWSSRSYISGIKNRLYPKKKDKNDK